MYSTVYDNLTVIAFDERLHARSCNYWYAVQNNHAAHTAFETRAGLLRWLSDRGLSVNEAELPVAPAWGWVNVTGKYVAAHHLSYDAFYALPAIMETKVMSNGDYTLGRITADADGVRTVHELNVNCKHRPVFDYRATALEVR